MTEEQLQLLVEQVSIDYFHRPFKHRALWNGRLRTTGGRYHLNDHHIDLNPKMLTDFDQATLVGVIKHELCHYHLHLAGYSGKHNTPEFKRLLKRVGGSRYAPKPKDTDSQIPHLRYVCQRCGQSYLRKRHINTSRYVCSRCHGQLRLDSKAAS
ncbi:SprT family protein [Levilactobacillus bambusae]|uniref:SprT family protein n=1 Tax=Levilactobacillus bambusae TaxID=2024736 RepID=A0A2V1MYY1_9LACO|nr:SprT family protein [Levilactobacillus bambusae]PWF99355.1 SprT family protein [Levilactobacillus bambusae]